MPKVKIVCSDDDAFPNFGTQLFVDGHELTQVRRIEVRIGVDAIATVLAEMFIEPGSEIEIPAAVAVNVVAEEGVVELERDETNGTTRVKFVRRMDVLT